MTVRSHRGGRKKRTIIEETVPEGSDLVEDPLTEFDVSLEAADDTETLKAVLEQFGQTNQVLYRIYRQTPSGPSFCYESSTFDEMFIQRERGEGSYVARIYIDGRMKKSIPFQVDAPSNGTGKVQENGSSSHAAFLEKMILVLLTNQQNGGSAHVPTLADMTAALSNLDSLRGKQESGIEMLMKGIELARSIEPGGNLDWKSELIKTVKDAAPSVLGIVSQTMAAKNGTPVPQVPTEQIVPAAPVTPEQEEQQMNLMLKSTIAMMKSQYMQGLDVDSAVNLIMANAGHPMYQPVIQKFVSLSFEELVALDADLGKKPFFDLFKPLHDGLRSEFGGDDSVESDTGRNPGDVTDIRSHGSAGKAGA
jgi:hypothetical protein